MILTRREMLAFAAAAWALPVRAAASRLKLALPVPFSWEALTERAGTMARQPYVPLAPVASRRVGQIDYGLHQEISQAIEDGLRAERSREGAVSFFHLGRLFPKPVRIHQLDRGLAREVIYDKTLFRYPAGHPAERVPEDAGFAGFRIHDGLGGDWAAFLGASYFRTRGDLRQYGVSARGIAVNTANPRPPFTEEFPDFREFWIEPFQDGRVRVYALLDGPSITGAYRLDMTREPTVTTEVTCLLNLRADIVRLGVAPLTSMYFYGAANRFVGGDWRPAVHDSEGLAIWNGRGEKLWRPLNNPPRVMVSSFSDEGPKGFGLLQRERDFSSYQDGERAFERRPNLWVEPLGDWGKGSVQLLELPTRSEFEDNIGAFWVPAEPARAGAQYEYRYRLHWSGHEHSPVDLARCTATRMTRPWTTDEGGFEEARHVVLDFQGGALASLDPNSARLDVSFSPGGGLLEQTLSRHPEGDTDRWRVFLAVGTAEGTTPVEARLVLRMGDTPVSETWLAQLHRAFAS